MPMRLQEVHPALVHYPLAFLPLSVGADLLGRLTDSDDLRAIGRIGIALAAGSAAVAAVAGLAAQSEVNVEEGSRAYDALVTHRTLNAGLVVGATGMAVWRWGREEASLPYLALGAAALGTMGYSAYLGGKMVYDHGLGVVAADGLYEENRPVPELTISNAGEVVRTAVADIGESAVDAIEQMGRGDILPALGGPVDLPRGASPASPLGRAGQDDRAGEVR